MPRAVRFDQYGPVDVLQVVDVPRPTPGGGEVLVEVVTAGINPGEKAIREGQLAERWPATFPSGEGSDFAGRVVELGAGAAGFDPGDEVIGWSDERSSHADFVVVPGDHLTPKLVGVDWDQAGALPIAGMTAYAAVRAVAPKSGETVAVSGAAGGVGSIAVQLAKDGGAQVIGIASERNHDWLRALDVLPVAYGDGLADRLRKLAPNGIDAFVDAHGGGYVELAAQLGVTPDRIDTIIDYEAAAKVGAQTKASADASDSAVLATLADLIAGKRLSIPIAARYPLAQVREAYTELARGHTRGKILLLMR